MTDDMLNLRTVVEKTSDADLLREMISFAAQRLMDLEAEGQTGATYRDKSPERLAQRNGYRDGISETRAGAVELRIPKLRKALLFPVLSGAATYVREGAHRIRAGRLDPLSGRSAGHGHERHLQEPGEPTVWRDRPEGEGLLRPSDRGRLSKPRSQPCCTTSRMFCFGRFDDKSGRPARGDGVQALAVATPSHELARPTGTYRMRRQRVSRAARSDWSKPELVQGKRSHVEMASIAMTFNRFSRGHLISYFCQIRLGRFRNCIGLESLGCTGR